MSDLAAAFDPRGWFVLGGVLLVAEILLPGAFLLWLGLAALATGALAWLVVMGWQIQVLAFAALAVICVLIGRRMSPAPAPPAIGRFSTAGRKATWGASSSWMRPSSRAAGGCASMTACGASKAPIYPPAPRSSC